MQILVVDDHPLFRQARRRILGSRLPSVRTGEAASADIATLTPAQVNVPAMITSGKLSKRIAHEFGLRNRIRATLRVAALEYSRVGFPPAHAGLHA